MYNKFKSKFNILFQQVMNNLTNGFRFQYCKIVNDNLTQMEKQQLNKKWDEEVLNVIIKAKQTKQRVYLRWSWFCSPENCQIINIFEQNNYTMCEFYAGQYFRGLNRINYYVQRGSMSQSSVEYEKKQLQKDYHKTLPISQLLTKEGEQELFNLQKQFKNTDFSDKVKLLDNINDDIKFVLNEPGFEITKNTLLNLLKSNTAKTYKSNTLLKESNISNDLIKKFNIDVNSQQFKKAQENFKSLQSSSFYFHGGPYISLIVILNVSQGKKFDINRITVQFTYKYGEALGDNQRQLQEKGYIRD